MFVVFDLDGTLANTDHRQHLVSGPEKDWDGFFGACDLGAPVVRLIELLNDLQDVGHRVEVWSGRSDAVRRKTVDWLCKHGVSAPLRMRAAGDHRPDVAVKRGWLEAEPQAIDLVFDDRRCVVDMWREHGILCCQVAEGNF